MASNWDELQEKERKRRLILGIRSSTYPKLLTRYEGTIFDLLFVDPMFWITILIYIGVRLIDTYVVAGDASNPLSQTNVTGAGSSIAVISTFLNFILTPMVATCVGNLKKMTDFSAKEKGYIIQLAQIWPGDFGRQESFRLIRLMNAAHMVMYIGRSDEYTKENFFDVLNSEKQLLTGREMELIKAEDVDTGGMKHMNLILRWVIKEINDQYEKGAIVAPAAQGQREMVMNFRRTASNIHCDIPPIPFVYYHLITVLLIVFLPLFAIRIAYESSASTTNFTISDILNGVILILQAMYVLGLRKIMAVFMDTYGGDGYDLSVLTYVLKTWKTSYNLVAMRFEGKEAEKV